MVVNVEEVSAALHVYYSIAISAAIKTAQIFSDDLAQLVWS